METFTLLHRRGDNWGRQLTPTRLITLSSGESHIDAFQREGFELVHDIT